MTAKQRAARAKFKAVVAEAKKLRKKNPKLTQAQAVKQAWAISYGKKRAEVGAVKKKAAPKKKAATKVKAKKRASTEMHTDTKSHNVNIRVISGIAKAEKAINAKLLDELNDILNKIRNDEEVRDSYKIALKYGKIQKEDRPKARGIVKFYNQNIKEYKEHFRQLKKQLK